MDKSLELAREGPWRHFALETERWFVEVEEKEGKAVLTIRCKSGEFILTDLGTGKDYYPAIKLDIALREKRFDDRNKPGRRLGDGNG